MVCFKNFEIEVLNLIKFIILFLLLCDCLSLHGKPEIRVELSDFKLGTKIHLIVYHADSIFARNKLEEAVCIIDSLNSIFSDYEEASELNRLSRSSGNKSAFHVSNELFSLIDTALYISYLTDGAFDITCGPLTHLWRESKTKGRIPSKKKICQNLKNVGYKFVQLNTHNSTVLLLKKGMQLDAGGIAKGYIADIIGKFLRREGLPSYMIDLGGDIATGRPPPGKPGWSIRMPGNGIIHLANKAIATSGPDYQFIVYKSKKYSHIIDPRTGWGVTDPRTVTVINRSGMMADALASAFSVISISESIVKLNRFVQTSVYIKENSKKFVSEEFPEISY